MVHSIKTSAHVYSVTEVDVSKMVGFVKRTRDEESNVSLEYIQSVTDKHDSWLEKSEKSPVYIIEVNRDFVGDSVFREEVIDRIVKVISKNIPHLHSSDSEKSFEELVESIHR